MSFWSDASPVVKGVVVIGAIAILVLIAVWSGIGPFGGAGGEATQQRGLNPAAGGGGGGE